jgi:hypothetical protein
MELAQFVLMPPPRRTKKPVDLRALLRLMDDWPRSWMIDDEDETVGRELTALMRIFFTHLAQHGLSAKTLRRHLDNLWVIGGEIIRELQDSAALRRKDPPSLLLHFIGDGEAPLIADLDEAQQRSADSTARMLAKFTRTSHE